ncbi:ABC transporter ATP-binding protein [Propionicicella superfundia]|uniref:ABC transporter ATP-binding protein n=1 Tax=Propionicicella superfundia TaxID=348582 RepID=UPI0003F65826|nr:ABC transporter ATP-binding protein [Propionicicella superfundia]
MTLSAAVVELAAYARDLTKVYGSGPNAVHALAGVDLEIARGSFTAVMGPSGSGKSTLMHCLAGLDRVTTGHVYIGDSDITTLPDRDLTRLRRDRIGFIFQAFNLLPTMTGLQNIVLPLELAGRRVDLAAVHVITDSLGITDRLGHLPSQLSGGEQQRVAVARALVSEPDLIFADEPTGALDTRTGRALLEYLAHASSSLGHTIVMVTHDPIAAAYAERAIILSDGRIVQDIPHPTSQDALAALNDADVA